MDMKILVQWSLSDPDDWEEIDSSQWSQLSKKPEPHGNVMVNNKKGWIHALCVQGVVFSADHYSIQDIKDGVRVITWNDDPVDWPVGMRHARVWDILKLEADSEMNGAINTRQYQTIYGENDFLQLLVPMQHTVAYKWSNFIKPQEKNTIHGIEVEDNLHITHLQKRSERGWREWTDGLDDSEIKDGKVKNQRSQGRYVIPDGTRTYYQRDTDRATSAHSATNEDAFETTTGTANTESASAGAGSAILGFAFTTPTSEPDTFTWPIGNYRCQLDVDSSSSNNQYGLLALGSITGHFGRISSTTVVHRSNHQQTESAFTGTGLKLATTGSVDFSGVSAAQTDRFECVIAIQNTAAHGGPQSTTLQLNTSDSFADGPWAAPPTPPAGPTVLDGINLFSFGGL